MISHEPPAPCGGVAGGFAKAVSIHSTPLATSCSCGVLSVQVIISAFKAVSASRTGPNRRLDSSMKSLLKPEEQR
jgi:hypothetical protein